MRKLLPILVVFITASIGANGQCPSGYRAASLNWDGLDYFSTVGYNMNALSGANSPNQSFAFGKNRLNITYSGAGLTSAGENAAHTGSAGGYGAGEDVQYSGNGTITLNFATAVSNLKFTLYDVDGGQSIAFSATNGGSPAAVTLSKTATSTNLTITGATATGSGNIKSNDPDATLNVDVAGPVTSVTMVISGTGSGSGNPDTDYWLSDIAACITDIYTPDFAVSRPFTGMPSYVLTAINNEVYMVDPATGRAKYIFDDHATSGTINSLAYDPVNKIAYYTWSLTNNGSANASQKTIRKYDFKTGAGPTTVTNDANLIGVLTFGQGVESGAAAFYDSALYIGIEGGADNGNGGPRNTSTGIESIIWRINFDAAGNPSTVSQVYSTSGDTHDWGDFSISNDTLYDANGESGGAHYQHMSLYTGDNLRVNYISALPRQTAVGWDGTVYNVGNSIGVYDLAGRTKNAVAIFSNPTLPNWSNTSAPSFGDAAEAFRPAVDFGDAPITYDPDPMAPALHETISTLRLGATSDVEWDKPVPGNTASVDGADEDGLPFVTILNQGGNYVTTVNAYNNTGGSATVVAWLDINGNGTFDAGEGRVQTINSLTTMQPVQFVWGSTATDIPNNSYTFLRIRITSASNSMTTANATGYFPDGEVEDYRVLVTTSTLAVKLTEFAARKNSNGQVGIQWSVTGEEAGTAYELQRSADGQHYEPIHSTAAAQKNATSSYRHMDAVPHQGENYYRLKITEPNGAVTYSAVSKVVLERQVSVTLAPNPAAGSVRLSVYSEVASLASVRLVDLNSRTVYEKTFHAAPGVNQLTVPLEGLMPGIYQAEVWIGSNRYTQSLVVKK